MCACVCVKGRDHVRVCWERQGKIMKKNEKGKESKKGEEEVSEKEDNKERET